MQKAPSPTETTDLRILDPKQLRFFRHGATLRLTIEEEACWLKVAVLRVFPLSLPDRYVSIRDGGMKEVGMIVDPKELDEENRRLVAEELERRYLVPLIRRFIAVKERFGTVEWQVETDRGPSTIMMRDTRENIRQLSPNRYLLTDVDSNRYDVRDFTGLDATSQGLLLRYL